MIKIKGKTMNAKGYLALAAIIMLIIGVVIITNSVTADEVNSEPVDNSVSQEVTPVSQNIPILENGLKEIDVVVRQGDTAWDIQSELTPGRDISAILGQLEVLNQADLSNLKKGSVVKFAIEK